MARLVGEKIMLLLMAFIGGMVVDHFFYDKLKEKLKDLYLKLKSKL